MEHDLQSLHYPNLLLRQPVQRINHPVNLFVRGFNPGFQFLRYFAFPDEVFFPFGFFRDGQSYQKLNF